jgi:hypothetical protein
MKLSTSLVIGALLFTACSGNGESHPLPVIDAATAASLQARAFQRACRDVVCAGAPIYAPATTPDDVRQSILALFTDEVEYLTDVEIEQRTTSEGRFADGATLIGVRGPGVTERRDVFGVNVSISKGHRDFHGRTYLFLWNGSEWADVSPDAVNVTVTSSVS